MVRFNSWHWLILPLASILVLGAQPIQAQTVIYRSRTVYSEDYSPSYGIYQPHYPIYRRVYRSPRTVIRGNVDDSTLIRPTIINSTIEDSTLVNPVIVSPQPSYRTQRPLPAQSNPACMAFRELRIACQ